MTGPEVIPLDQLISRVRRRFEPLFERQATIDMSGGDKTRVYPSASDLAGRSNRDLAEYIDHTLLKLEAPDEAIDNLCAEALRYRFAAVCIYPKHIARCARRLDRSSVRIATVVDFPHGVASTAEKVKQTSEALQAGAHEIDMVINIPRLKDGEHGAVLADITAVVQAASPRIVKVIVEAGSLTREELVSACLLSQAADAAFVKTSTGMAPIGARLEDVQAIRRIIGPWMGLKASGGIATAEAARAMLLAGANRLGTSKSVAIVSEL